MSLGRIKPKYVSLSYVNDGSLNNNLNVSDSSFTTDAEVYENYGYQIIEKANDLVCAVERMEVSLNGIPFYKRSKIEHNAGTGGYEQIAVVNRGDDNKTEVRVDLWTNAQAIAGTNVRDFYSLKEILDQLSRLEYPVVDVNGNDTGLRFTAQFTIDEQGYIRYTANQVTILGNQYNIYFSGTSPANTSLNLRIYFPQYLNMILGLGERKGNDNQTIISDFPRFDLGDELAHILLTTSLPVISDSVGQTLQQVLTDFAPSSTYGGAYTINGNNLQSTGVTLNSRQKLIYVPAEKRYLDLTSPFHITEIRVSASYVTNYGKTLKVPLPLGGMFQIKIGFYHK